MQLKTYYTKIKIMLSNMNQILFGGNRQNVRNIATKFGIFCEKIKVFIFADTKKPLHSKKGTLSRYVAF